MEELLLTGISKTQYIDMAMLEKIVETDSKQRYSFNEGKTLIRANQGHSIDVDVELPKKQPPVILYHGRGEKYVASIDELVADVVASFLEVQIFEQHSKVI